MITRRDVEGRGEGRSEQITHTLSDLEVDRLSIRDREVTWSGRLTGDDRSLPVTLTVRLEGVRITLVGGDGIMGDQIVANPAQAKDAAEKAGLDTSEWDRELVSKATTEPGHHERMAGYRAASR